MTITTPPIDFMFDDGGRAEAGYLGTCGDCVVRAIAIATMRPYQEVYDALNLLAQRERRIKGRRSNSHTGVRRSTCDPYMRGVGWTWTPTMKIGQGCQVHLRAAELPSGRLIVSLSKHWAAVIDGCVHDLSDPSRDGLRCVYGYWHAPSI